MVHQLVERVQEYVDVLDINSGKEEEKQVDKEKEWTVVLLLDHIRSRKHYIKLLERWTRQLQLFGMLLLGRSILVMLHGDKPKIKEFCHLLKTVKIDVDSSGKKCKEKMMKVLIETSSFSSCVGLQGFVVKNYESLEELSAAFQDINMKELFQQISLVVE
ncbi:unnamed protein product [Tetraodon nigroviridis]|uniref:(spotted green pufferfish) hypothetical protein n=1 Tax=Tetraodon nigroviridis TaxID=99883 RepID=Q4SV38_TETNG|nr:unnamed protein product [Tetraodon nigroviridis]